VIKIEGKASKKELIPKLKGKIFSLNYNTKKT
jgi:hypothetical protein